MKKLVLIGCAILFVCCVAKKSTVATEGLEEVVVFGEEPGTSEQPVVTAEVPPLPPIPEEITPPPVTAEAVTLPTPELPAPPVVEAPVLPPPVAEEPVITPPVVEAPVLPPVVELPELPPATEVYTPPAVVEEPIALPPVTEVAVAPPVLPPTPTYTPTPTPSVAPSAVYGFRVQIFASSTQKNASRVADDARASFGGKVYVEHVAPYYKVRVGDCLTQGEAITLKNRALSLGFRGAFVVETMVSP